MRASKLIFKSLMKRTLCLAISMKRKAFWNKQNQKSSCISDEKSFPENYKKQDIFCILMEKVGYFSKIRSWQGMKSNYSNPTLAKHKIKDKQWIMILKKLCIFQWDWLKVAPNSGVRNSFLVILTRLLSKKKFD